MRRFRPPTRPCSRAASSQPRTLDLRAAKFIGEDALASRLVERVELHFRDSGHGSTPGRIQSAWLKVLPSVGLQVRARIGLHSCGLSQAPVLPPRVVSWATSCAKLFA